jgi:hypothetical protein
MSRITKAPQAPHGRVLPRGEGQTRRDLELITLTNPSSKGTWVNSHTFPSNPKPINRGH